MLALGIPRLAAAAAPGAPPTTSDIVTENQMPGNPPSEWDIVGAGDPSIQGFATDISYAPGETVEFKIDTDATDYRLDVYRLGWYGGLGARLVDTVQPSATLPQVQPAPLTDAATGLTDCGNWTVSASWVIPASAVSGIYFAKLVREDPEDGRASHIAFVVRDDMGGSDILFQTSDTTWQAYNTYGGNSFYEGSSTSPSAPRAHKISYNRPFVTRTSPTEDWLFNAEYPMVRWLERNGYDVSYSTDTDTDRRGAELLEHRVFLSVGHDEYWSAAQRAAVEAARDAGVHLAFFSGNEIYWKVRWETSTDGSATPYRTLVCYKEGTSGEIACGTKCDPLPGVWTGLWRSGCEYPAADGCNPENALSGQISWVGSTGAIRVPQTDGTLRFWRNTSIASLTPGQTATLADGTLGYEWDFEQYEDSYPAGRVVLSTTTLGGQTHHLSLYRHASGALVFGAGSVQWSWGLDGEHDRGGSTPDARMQQATVNLLADMDAQPATLQAGLVAAAASTDGSAPVSSIDAPLAGSTVAIGVPTTVSGIATDSGGGVVGAVEVSVDGGSTWRRATGREMWNLTWTPAAYGAVTLLSRATDDSGNSETPGAGVTVAVTDVTSAPPDTPVAANDFYSTDANVVLDITAPGVLANDSDPNLDPLTAVLRSGPTHGTLTLDPDGSFTYTPVVDFTGSDSFTYRAEDPALHQSAPATVTIAVAQECPCSIWSLASAPESPYEADTNPVELGVRFQSDADGFVTGVRFYKHLQNSGPHSVRLWTTGGGELAAATSVGESSQGWQEVSFPSPVAITAGSVYLASYHTSTGYAQDDFVFAAGPVDNAPLHALQDGVAGPNGVYTYGPAGSFPTTGYQAGNYYVDVVFVTSVGPDSIPPAVTSTVPGDGATGVSSSASVSALFSEAMDGGTLSTSTFELRDPGNALVAATVSYDVPSRTATLDPTAALAYSTTYTARITTAVQDLAGNPLGADHVWSFTTAAPPPPPPDEGPGGPILVIADAADPFGRYYAEILRCEGLNAFTVTDITLVTPAVLATYDVAILASTSLAPGQVTMFADWVDAGGNLIAMRPDAQLAGLLGLTSAGGTTDNAYLLVDTASGPGVGIVGETMQFHGSADHYTAPGATVLATLYSDAATATPYAAVTLRSVGANGGQAACFTYDLARSIVYTRQGNPAWSGQERDGISPIRSDDLFYGAAAGDPQPDWVDLSKVAIPQADEQQRLLANLILAVNGDRKPLPRFWYFPRGLQAVVVMTGDDHGSAGMAPRFDTYLAESPSGCSLPDWECVRASGYMYVGAPFTDAQALTYHNLGFEVGLHVNTGCADWTPASLESDYDTQLAGFAAAYPSVPLPTTHRTHCIAWSDWATQPKIEVLKGIRLDTNYYYWPPTWVLDRPGLFTGSGMPMRFADLDGTMIDCYQVTTQMTDESGQTFPYTIDTLLDRALGPEGYYGAFCANMHFDSAPHAGSDAIVASALARGVPVVSGSQMLEWLDGRNGSSFGSIAWTSPTLGFTIAVGAGANNLRAMVPASVAVGDLVALTRDAVPVAWTTLTVKGIEYAMFPALPGSYEALYQPDLVPPAISGVTATPHTDGTATIAWTTDEPASSHVDYGTQPDSLLSTADDAALVTAHSIVLGGLTSNVTYFYRVSSTDDAANAATQPEPPGSPLSFTMPDVACAMDVVYADFAAGDPGSGTYVARAGDGEVILAPAAGSEFESGSLPAGWADAPWSGGGATTFSGGSALADGTLFGPTTTFGPGSSLEFVATFGSAHFQHVGFSDDFNSTWMIFSTGSTTTDLLARTNPGTNTTIPGSWLGTPHRFRIDWKATSIDYFIDDVLVVSHPYTIGGSLRAVTSDLDVGGPVVQLDWLHVTPYAGSGSFASRIFDAGVSASWGALTWTGQTPSGTSLAMLARTGETPAPDGSWTPFAAVPSSGSSLGASGRYVQVRADLATSDSRSTPVLEDVTIECSTEPDAAPPVITNVAAAPEPTGTGATITWDTDEPADSRVDYGTSPAALLFSASTPALVYAHSVPLPGLVPGTTYWYRVTSADAATNAATEPAVPDPPLSFTTPVPPCFVDAASADFEQGAPDAGAYVADTSGGEVLLAPTAGAEFSGTALPAGWASFPWDGGGTATVAGGLLTVDGTRVNSVPGPGFGPGRTLEFVATFVAAPYQHIGFGGGNDLPPGEIFNTSPWAMFSTGSGGTALQARVWDGGSFLDFTIPGSWLGAAHRYRIDWTPSGFGFSIDGALVHSQPTPIGTSMRPAISDVATNGTVLGVDWIRMSDYASFGSFESRVFDAGASALWGPVTWTSDEPAGTSLAIGVRTGETPVPDGGWSSYTAIPSSGTSVGASARYIQYRADLATSDVSQTPALLDVSVACFVCADTMPPAALTGLTASRLETGNDADGTMKIQIEWPAAEPGATVRLYRKGFGNYPEYDDPPSPGAVPAVPASPSAAEAGGWVQAASLTAGETTFVDEPGTRDFWYYAAFVEDACGNVSAASNRSAGTLDYILGDTSNGATPGTGNNHCSTEDLSDLGAHYGAVHGSMFYRDDLDYGPTHDTTVHGRPTTDDRIDFEELILLAIGYEHPAGKSFVRPPAATRDELVVWAPDATLWPAPGEMFDVTLTFAGSGSLQGLQVGLAWDRSIVEPVTTGPGPLLEAQGGTALSPCPGAVDIVLLGRQASGLTGDGVVATMTFRVLAHGDPRITLDRAAGRDRDNRDAALAAEVRTGTPDVAAVPRETSLLPNVPNPFNPTTRLRFDLAAAGRVRLQIYAVTGRLVRTVLDEPRTAGSWSVPWDGRDSQGGSVASGIYLVRMEVAGRVQTRRITLLK